MNALLLITTVATCAADVPQWVGRLPDPMKPDAGLPRLNATHRVTVYSITTGGCCWHWRMTFGNWHACTPLLTGMGMMRLSEESGANNSFGLYNHGPMVMYHNGSFLCTWYNAPLSESHDMRVLLSSSPNGLAWSQPQVVFPAVDTKGEENEPLALVNGRLYAAASDVSWGNGHDSGLLGALLMRQILSPTEFGPIFWLATANTVPKDTKFDYPLYTQMDATVRSDVEAYLATLVNETVSLPTTPKHSGGSPFNERSLYKVPHATSLVLLLRSGHSSPHLWAATCDAPFINPEKSVRQDLGSYSCKSGTGAFMFEQPSFADALEVSPRPLQCNWSSPLETNIPDAPSRTCAAHLPNDIGIGLLGNQGGPGGPYGPRNPLTFLIAKDGMRFTEHWAIEGKAPPPKWPHLGHPQGYQYPSFMWCSTCGSVTDTIIFSYSVSKEDIVLTIAPLTSLTSGSIPPDLA